MRSIYPETRCFGGVNRRGYLCVFVFVLCVFVFVSACQLLPSRRLNRQSLAIASSCICCSDLDRDYKVACLPKRRLWRTTGILRQLQCCRRSAALKCQRFWHPAALLSACRRLLRLYLPIFNLPICLGRLMLIKMRQAGGKRQAERSDKRNDQKRGSLQYGPCYR